MACGHCPVGDISTLHINAILISMANIILCHLPPESIATLWYYHIISLWHNHTALLHGMFHIGL